jgi:hypothetical protein
VAAMEDVLEVYHRPHDAGRPVVCLDETSKQLIAETRVPIPAKPGKPERYDYEYERNGTANLFMMFAPLEGWRHVKVTDRHTALDYAQVLNTDQGSQFTSPRFTAVLRDAGIRISMGGRGRWMDNVFIERLWRSLKYECVYLHAFETGSELRAGLSQWIGYYNARRPHSTLAGRTPDEAYRAMDTERLAG